MRPPPTHCPLGGPWSLVSHSHGNEQEENFNFSIQFNLILFPMEFQFTNILMLREEDGMAKRGQRGPGTVLPPTEKLLVVGADRNC